MTVDSLDQSSAGARMTARRNLATVEERVRRDTGRTSVAISVLWIAVLFAAVYAVGWRINIGRPQVAATQPNDGVRPPVEVGNPGKFGIALDQGERPNPNDEAPVAAAQAEAAPLADADSILEAIAARLIDDLNPNDVKFGHDGGPIALNKKADGAGPDGPARRRSERWLVEWGTDTESGYRRKLDHFGIYLGAVRDGQLVSAMRSFGAPLPESTMTPPSLWFIHRDSRRVELDRKLLAATGVKVLPTDIVAQFFPRQLQATLTSLEERFSHKNASEIKKTVFGVRAAGAGYEFFVVEQQLK